MNLPKVIITLFVVLLSAVVGEFALAANQGRHSGGGRPRMHHSIGPRSGSHHFHRSRAGLGLIVVSPAFWYYSPPYYYPPYYYPPYYYPWSVAVPSSPPVYIEQDQAEPAPAPEEAQAYWYYCPDAESYYPYVKECPGGWERIVPDPLPPG